MALGLSRTAAIALADTIAADDLNEEAVTQAVKALPLESLNISPIIVQEVRRLLGE
jgi:hypothetical protein